MSISLEMIFFQTLVKKMNKLSLLYKKSKKISINNKSKIVIMSDCHRGIGNINDNFYPNKIIFEKALEHYYQKNFVYVELGDGDEMWEVKKYENIIKENLNIFLLLKKFYQKKRLLMIYGNHDIVKKNKFIIKKYFYKYNKHELFKNLIVYESLILKYQDKEIFLLHGHQIDFFNSTLWRLARFLVRYFWKTLERIGFKDPTKNLKNYSVTKRREKKLHNWSKKHNKILICGHTHRPIYPKNNSLYFNDGSCIFPEGISCIEIKNGKISLLKWHYEILNNKITITKKTIAGPKKINSFFK